MKKHIYILFLLPFIFTNCEEVVEDFNTNETNPQIVIEAKVLSESDSAYVLISKTGNYMDAKNFPPISNAVVSLKYGNNNITIPEISKGTYAVSADFTENTEYEILINVENETYTAKSQIIPKPKIDFVNILPHPYSMFMGENPENEYFMINFFLKDDAETENYYRLRITKNDTTFNSSFDLFLINDEVINGQTFEYSLMQYAFEEDDTVKLEFFSIDKANYVYYTTLKEAMSTTGNFSVPDNPKTNFSPYVLGHFEAASIVDTTIIVKPTF